MRSTAILIVGAVAMLPRSVWSQPVEDELVPSSEFPSLFSEPGRESLDSAMWTVFWRVVLPNDRNQARRVVRELTGLTGDDAELFASFAIDSWLQWEDRMRERISSACSDRDSELSPSALLDRILTEQYEERRLRQVAIAELFEQLGARATRTVVGSVFSERGEDTFETDMLLTVLREDPSEYLGRICTRVDPRNIADTSRLR